LAGSAVGTEVETKVETKVETEVETKAETKAETTEGADYAAIGDEVKTLIASGRILFACCHALACIMS